MKAMLEKIDYSNPENKHIMNDYFEMAMCSVEDNDKELYDHIKCGIYEIVYGKKLSEEMADKWVHDLKPMAKWTRDDVENVVNSYNLGIPVTDAYVIMNMLYSDSKNVYGDGDSEESLMKYIEGTKNWYFDEDAAAKGCEKLYNYWKYIVKY